MAPPRDASAPIECRFRVAEVGWRPGVPTTTNGVDVFESIDRPRELVTYQLGAALTMEKTVLEMLGQLETAAQRAQLKEQLRHHAQETEQQIRNLEQAFQALGAEVGDKPCPAIEGIEKEGQALIKKAEDGLVDAVILSGAADTEHHEISVYEGLITKAEAMGEQDIVALLQENLEQEQHTLAKRSSGRRGSSRRRQLGRRRSTLHPKRGA
jgi:ferritin-like metal-binding protein YciE